MKRLNRLDSWLFMIVLFTISISLTACNVETNPKVHCNMSIAHFLNLETGVIAIPSQIERKTIRSVTATVHFRESHGGFQSCLNLRNKKSNKITPLFCEVKFSDSNIRGDDDWLGSQEGNILGDAPYMKEVTLEPGSKYELLLSGDKPLVHELNLLSAKTNINDPKPDSNKNLYTFRGVVGTMHKSLPLLWNPDVSTLIGFEDSYTNEEKPDYDDVIIEMCLQVDY